MTKRPPKITGIPTVYRGINMRSRTEARWAAVFDELGWGWNYEPDDLRWYIPDFVLRFEEGPLLVEIKGAAIRLRDLDAHKEKLEASEWSGEFLLIGATPLEFSAAQPLVGLLGEPEMVEGSRTWRWGEARLFRCLSCNHASVLAADGSWHCRICGEGQGNAHVGAFQTDDGAGAFEQLWARATNRTQWRPGT